MKTTQPSKDHALTPRVSSRFTPRSFHAPQEDQREGGKANRTGLPDALKAGIENLSGVSLDDVKVNYASPKPAELNALAYAQGNHIHLAPGQERHLPHEAWHVVQQRQGRVRPTIQMKQGVPLNDDKRLEHEADTMGAKAYRTGQDVLSRQEAYGPGSRVGQGLIAHKFTHFVQENGGAVRRSPHGGTVQRLRDGFYGGKKKVPKEKISLKDPEFIDKHVAADSAAAKTITLKRVADNKAPADMVAGALPNTTATEINWINSIDNSNALIPDQDDWEGGMPIKITGWDVTYNQALPLTSAVAAIKNQDRTVGGYMKKKGGDVTIDHVAN